MAYHPPGSLPPGRLSIGFLAPTIDDGIGRLLWSGIHELCQSNGLNLVTFVGEELDEPASFSRHANIIYKMVDQGRLDGLVIWASSLSGFVGQEAILRFCDQYRPLPLVGIGIALPGIPSIILDSYHGTREVLLHLVQEHGRRRLAYLRGPDQHYEAQLRFQAYRDVVKEFGLDDNPDLITPPQGWSKPWGMEATRLLLEDRHVKFDGLACVNDMLAIGAMEYLQGRGINVPEDVSIVGFDNNLEGRFVTPPLTTVPTRMKERGRMAVRILMAQMAGENVPELVMLPTQVRLRLSCGCPDPVVMAAGQPALASASQASASPTGVPPLPLEIVSDPASLEKKWAEVSAEMEEALGLDEVPPGWAANLLNAFLNSQPEETRLNGFLTVLQRLLRDWAVAAGYDQIIWQRVINVLQARALPRLAANPDRMSQADRWLHQARVMIGEWAVRSQGHLNQTKNDQLNELLRIRQEVSGAQTLKELVDILARELPTLGIQRCGLALYEDPERPVDGARLMLAYDENGRYTDLEGLLFAPAWELVPLDYPSDQPQNLAVYPLYYRDEQLGFILLDVSTFQGTVHHILCEQLSSALKSVLLVVQNSQLYRQALESQRVAEEANLLKSRFLSMVSHELLTPMVLLVGLSEMMLREGIGNRPPLPEAYHRDLTRIHAGAQQLGSLVRDVLDLARGQLGQLKLTKRPVNLEEVFRPVILVGEQMTHSKGLTWRVDMPPNLPQIMGDAARLQQVALNLVSNAVKFTTQGEVALVVEVGDDQVTVSIQDTGLGVPLAEQEAIFDEFRQSERTVMRGYGGLGIGLAICRQLIQLHDGEMGVRSAGEENSGSTFYFVLPVQPCGQVDHPTAPSEKVLVLTSQAERADRLRQHLIQEGFQAETLGIEENPNWLAGVLAAPPGAVVLDVPVAERGWELIELLKGSPVTQGIPVIFYSLLQEQGTAASGGASNGSNNGENSGSSGGGTAGGAMMSMDYLSKPVAGAVLGRALERYGLSANGGCTVLLADDDLEILELHSRMVQEHIPGSRVLRAANGRVALDLMRQETPALVLLDLMMPELDGVGVLKAMQADDRLREIPVIVLTAQSLTQEEMLRLNRGVVSVLSKGVFTADETLAHIDRALAQTKRVGSDTQRLVRKVMAYIHEHYAEPLSREQMSNYAGVSERHLNRCFVQETGLSPNAYLNRYRIQKAKCMLKERSCSITEVMTAVGFSDSSYFTHVFRREVGVSPSEYQRGKRPKNN